MEFLTINLGRLGGEEKKKKRKEKKRKEKGCIDTPLLLQRYPPFQWSVPTK
jgi:hypothetical protein